jgi:hypothetical protein
MTDNGFDDKKSRNGWIGAARLFCDPAMGWWGKYVNGFWNTLFGKGTC